MGGLGVRDRVGAFPAGGCFARVALMPRPNQAPLTKREYDLSIELAARRYPFYALLAAAVRKADTQNMALLSRAFPGVVRSLTVWMNTGGAWAGPGPDPGRSADRPEGGR